MIFQEPISQRNGIERLQDTEKDNRQNQ